MTEAYFDEFIHSSIRLRICGLLMTTTCMQFAVIRDTLGISDAACSKQLRALQEHGYVALRKVDSALNKHKVIEVMLLPAGRHAFEGHMAALEQIARGAIHTTVA